MFKGRITKRRPKGRPGINYFHDVEEKMDIQPTAKESNEENKHTWLLRQSVAFST